MNFKQRYSGNSGFSLVSTLVGLSIVMGIIYASMQGFLFQNKTVAVQRQNVLIEGVFSKVRMVTSHPALCNIGFRDAAGNPVRYTDSGSNFSQITLGDEPLLSLANPETDGVVVKELSLSTIQKIRDHRYAVELNVLLEPKVLGPGAFPQNLRLPLAFETSPTTNRLIACGNPGPETLPPTVEKTFCEAVFGTPSCPSANPALTVSCASDEVLQGWSIDPATGRGKAECFPAPSTLNPKKYITHPLCINSGMEVFTPTCMTEAARDNDCRTIASDCSLIVCVKKSKSDRGVYRCKNQPK
jgi:hypothetical protein